MRGRVGVALRWSMCAALLVTSAARGQTAGDAATDGDAGDDAGIDGGIADAGGDDAGGVDVALSSTAGDASAFSTDLGPPPVADEEARSRSVGAGPWVLLGIAAAVYATGGVMLTLRESALTDRNDLCAAPEGACITATAATAQTAMSRQDDANTYNMVANISVAVGSAFLVGSLVWFLFGGRSSRSSSRAGLRFTPHAGGGEWGYGLSF
ncbi:MAG: hypothetical protein R3A52_26590 [Polyangiales bacterium]